MMKKKLLMSFLCSVIISAISMQSKAAGWCGISQKFDCGDWVVQMAVFNGGAMGPNDCVTYDNCVTSATWDWSTTGAWSQLFLEKEGFCGVNYSVSNSEDFNVSYDGTFSNASGIYRLAIVSWAKTTDNCNWLTDGNSYELYLHEESFNETDDYSGWCTPLGTSSSCSGSTYEMYDCGDQIIRGIISLRAWRNSPRTSGVTDVDCLWENFRAINAAPDVFYYFSEVGTEVEANSSGSFTINNVDMVRTEDPNATNPGDIVDGGVYKINVSGKYLTSSGGNVITQNGTSNSNQEWVIRNVNGNIFTLENSSSNDFLHVTGTSKGSNVNVTAATGGSDQEWEFIYDVQDQTRKIIDQLGSNYLTGAKKNNANTIVSTFKRGGGTQDWVLEFTGNTSRKVTNATLSSNALNAYFNNKSLVIEGKTLKSAVLYSLNGKIKWQSPNASDYYNINVSDLKNGLYVLRTFDVNGASDIKKLVLR